MVRLISSEKSPTRRAAGRERRRRTLQARAGSLVLEALGAKVLAERKPEAVGVSTVRPHYLAKIGGEAGDASETAMRRPGIGAPCDRFWRLISTWPMRG